MTWNHTVLSHPHLSPTDKLVFHLLAHLGGDTPTVRRQLTALLGLCDRQLRRISAKLQRCGAVDNSPASEGSVDNSRTCTSAADIDVHPADTQVRLLNAPTRTLWSSSSEEDKNSTPLPVPTPGGAGGTEPNPEMLGQMKDLWQQIDPGCSEVPLTWLTSLCREFGPERPLSVLRRFALAEKTLAALSRPASFKSYFARWCRREQEEDEALLSQALPAARASPWRCSWASADHDQALASAYNATRKNRPPQRN